MTTRELAKLPVTADEGYVVYQRTTLGTGFGQADDRVKQLHNFGRPAIAVQVGTSRVM